MPHSGKGEMSYDSYKGKPNDPMYDQTMPKHGLEDFGEAEHDGAYDSEHATGHDFGEGGRAYTGSKTGTENRAPVSGGSK